MKVFISWSGTTSHKVAKILRDWLPSVIQSIRPYVSSEDIDKGARWSSDIAGELDASSFGILCLTPDNIEAPWINFEAGALGKSVDKSKVCPFLFKIQRSDVDGPLLQFQSTIFEKDDVYKLIQSMNLTCGADALDDARLRNTFDVWWPNLQKLLDEIPESKANIDNSVDTEPESTKFGKVLEELLDLTRSNHKILRDPSSLIPTEHLEHAWIRSQRRQLEIPQSAIKEIIMISKEIKSIINNSPLISENTPESRELLKLVSNLEDMSEYISRRVYPAGIKRVRVDI